ncbi:MAG: hypothetical protein ACR2L3_03600 [Actinomycetota bacterium]
MKNRVKNAPQAQGYAFEDNGDLMLSGGLGSLEVAGVGPVQLPVLDFRPKSSVPKKRPSILERFKEFRLLASMNRSDDVWARSIRLRSARLEDRYMEAQQLGRETGVRC